MHISKVTITGFKCFKERFEFPLQNGLNIIVGNNEAGKSTILEAVHLTLSGLSNGKYLKNELSEYLFNNDLLNEFRANPIEPPEILIELFFEGENLAIYEGDGNSERKKNCGISLTIALDEKEKESYDNYIKECNGNVSLPIEYYELTWRSFAREIITTKHLPIKAALIDSSSNRYQNGSDIYLSHIIKQYLEPSHRNTLAQAHRRLQEIFRQEPSVNSVNAVIREKTKKNENDKEIKIDIDLSSKNVWENSMIAYVENVPFHNIGKGQQAIVKTKLALEKKSAVEANVILLEEPENHLSHARLNQLLDEINEKCNEKSDKQLIISTHSSFVANKLGLDRLILLNDKKQTKFQDLTPDTIKFFKTISGYDTLRFILCDSAILCEGDSDELIIQKKYLKKFSKLPIQNGIEIISVGLSFSRYIEIAKPISKRIAIVTDNDKKAETLIEKYKEYNSSEDSLIKVFFDIDNNFPTLEPQMIKANGWELVNRIIDQKYKKDGDGYKKGDDKCKNEVELLKFMQGHKTDCALKFFETNTEFNFPKYIEDAIEHAEKK